MPSDTLTADELAATSQQQPCQNGQRRPCGRQDTAYYIAVNAHPLLAALLGVWLCPAHARKWVKRGEAVVVREPEEAVVVVVPREGQATLACHQLEGGAVVAGASSTCVSESAMCAPLEGGNANAPKPSGYGRTRAQQIRDSPYRDGDSSRRQALLYLFPRRPEPGQGQLVDVMLPVVTADDHQLAVHDPGDRERAAGRVAKDVRHRVLRNPPAASAVGRLRASSSKYGCPP